MPDHGLLVNVVAPGSNAASHGVKAGDVLLAYNGTALHKQDDLKTVPEGGKLSRRRLARRPDRTGWSWLPASLASFDPRPAPRSDRGESGDRTKCSWRRGSGDEDFDPLPWHAIRSRDARAALPIRHDRPTRILLGADASEPELDRLAASGELGRFGFIHLATHGVIDEEIPSRSAVILTQTGLPDPLEQVLNHKPAFDGRLSVREIQRGWNLKAELVTLSACETALGREAGGEGFVGFTQALLDVGHAERLPVALEGRRHARPRS